ncbi:serine hydrolase [Streptomyces sp. NPDC090021]|uniref:D-alanyl-D-alanine carboxypeptidase family protein n=1 Tax=Streptomyces sp. NPDC090021 TaxID=3365919 RepID=UPI003810C6C6
MKAVTVTGGSSDDPKSEGTTVTGEGPEKTASPAEPESAAADAGAGTKTDTGTATETETDDSTRSSDSAGSSEPGPTGAQEPQDTDARPAAEVEAEAAQDSPAAGTGAETESRPEGAAEGADAGESQPHDTKPASEARAAETRAQAPAAPAPAADEPDSEAETEDETDAEEPRNRVLRVPDTAAPDPRAPETKASAEAEPEGENSRTRAPRVPGTATPDSRKAAKPEPDDEDAGAGAGAGADKDSRTQILRVPGTATPEARKAAKPKPEAKDTDPDADADADAAKDSRTQVLRVPEPKATEPKAEDEPEPEAGNSRTQVLRVPGATAAKPKPEAADGAGRVSGAASPEPRTTAEAEPGPRPEDGARKVPSWAAAREEDSGRAPDPDPERTSRFVPLKEPDAAPPVTAHTRPQAHPQARPQAPAPQPLPPLDLLAELTNTPPPAETPRRTVLRRVKVWTPILLLLVGACIGGQMLRPLPDPRLVAAETDHTVDGQVSLAWPAKGQGAVRVVGSGDVATFGEQKPVPTASVAKIMTAYVILKNHPLRKADPGPDITVDAKAVADGNSEHESRITGLTAGSKFSQQDMLKMLMIPSGNNIARLLARWDTGTDSEAAFVEKMNAAARELGMKDTTYTDPSGLDAGTVSTATDQLKLAEAVMKDEAFRAIVALPEAPIKGLGEKLVNNNHLLTESGLSIRGIKTGSSTPAGGTFVWAAYKTVGDKDQLIIGSLMEQRAPAPDKDALNSLALVKANSKKIIESVRTALASTPLVRKGDVVGHVDDGLGGRTALVAVKDLDVISMPGQQFKLSLKPGASPLPHTAKDGTEVGVLTAGEGDGARSVPVAVKGALAEPSFGTRLTRLG